MLIQKPSLYIYIPTNDVDDIMENGLKLNSETKTVSSFFSRLPESESFEDFCQNNAPLKVSVSKLKRIKDQIIKLYAINLKGYENKDLTEKDIEKIESNPDNVSLTDNDFSKINIIPKCKIYCSGAFLPAFVMKRLK